MNRLDDENLGLDETDEVLRIIHWGRWILGGIMLILIALFVSGWLLRKGVAERAMAAWCEQQSLICTADFDEVGPDGASLSNLVIRAGGDVPLRAGRVEAQLDWPGIFQPKLKSVIISQPVLRGEFRNGRLSLFGLEDLATGGGTGGDAALQIEVIDGHVVIATDAGDVTARATIKGALPQNGDIVLTLDPADLDGPEGRIKWTGGDVNIHADDGRLDGIVNLRLETAALKGLTLNGAILEARIETDSALEVLNIVDLSGAVEEAIWADGEVSQMAVTGAASLSRVPKMSVADARAALQSLTFDVTAGKAVYGTYGGDQIDFAGVLRRGDGELTGPLALTAANVVSTQASANSIILTGDASVSAGQGWRFDGRGVVEGASLPSELRRKGTKAIALPSVLAGHGGAMRTAVDRLLSGFDTAIEFQARKTGADLTVDVMSPIDLKSKSGARVKIDPPQGQRPVSFRNGDIELAGVLSMSGGGLPKLHAAVEALKVSESAVTLDASNLALAPWTVAGRTIGGKVSSLSVAPTRDGMQINANGKIELSGAFPGANLEPTKLSGKITAISADKNWTVSQQGSQCLGVETAGLKTGAVAMGKMNFSACPEAGRFLHKGAGSLKLADISIPFSTGKSGGVVSLKDASLDYDAQKGVSLTILAKQLRMPMMIGDRSFSVEGATPRLGVITGHGPPRLSARLGRTQFSGELVPASVSAAAFTFDGSAPASGVSGGLKASSVIVEDYRDDPMFQPLITDIDARLTNGRMTMSAPVRLKRGGITVATADVDLDILKLNGDATVRTRTLTFKDGGLQPHMLSDRLRGFFTSATGVLEGQADLAIQRGKVAGTGRVQITGFGFQTQRLGRVTGVNGAVNFTDLLGLTTAPRQVVTVASMDPGVPLSDGRLEFQLIDGKVLSVSEAVFPFAGGEMKFLPMAWQLGGKKQAFEVVASDIELDALIAALKLPDVKASGTVSGRFPIRIDDAKILIEDAVLIADPQGGRLAYTGVVGDQASAAGEYGEMAFKALKNLKFSVLKLGLDGNVAGDMRVDLLLIGENHEVLNGQPFEFDISIDSKLAQLLQSRLYYSNEDWLETISTGQAPGRGTVGQDE